MYLTGPMAGAGLTHRIPAGRVQPVIFTAAEDMALLASDDLRPDAEARSVEALGDPVVLLTIAAALFSIYAAILISNHP